MGRGWNPPTALTSARMHTYICNHAAPREFYFVKNSCTFILDENSGLQSLINSLTPGTQSIFILNVFCNLFWTGGNRANRTELRTRPCRRFFHPVSDPSAGDQRAGDTGDRATRSYPDEVTGRIPVDKTVFIDNKYIYLLSMTVLIEYCHLYTASGRVYCTARTPRSKQWN